MGFQVWLALMICYSRYTLTLIHGVIGNQIKPALLRLSHAAERASWWINTAQFALPVVIGLLPPNVFFSRMSIPVLLFVSISVTYTLHSQTAAKLKFPFLKKLLLHN